jgi:hypothetical protein
MRKVRICPASQLDIELTDPIKEFIMNNRVYHLPKEEPVIVSNESKTINQTINNFNTLMNFVGNIDTMKKITECVQRTNTHIIPFDEAVGQRYLEQKIRLERDHGNHMMCYEDALDTIDAVTKVKGNSIEDFNILYDSDLNKFILYESNDWKEFFLTSGVKAVVRSIQDNLWNAYECYLIRKIQKCSCAGKAMQQQDYLNYLKDYYEFLGCIEVDPFVKDATDNNIAYNSDHDEYFNGTNKEQAEHFYNTFRSVKNGLTMRRRDVVKHELVDLIKRNTRKNVNDLNKVVVSMINVDAEFKRDMLSIE